jgi:hypothetical protein
VKYALARGLQAAALTIICACIVGATLFFPRAEETQQSEQYGDLQHLQFTATGKLPVRFMFPQDGFASASVATRVSAETVNGAGVALQINGADVPSRNLGRMAVSKTGTTVYDFYGVLLHPGPNTIIATAIGANGVRGESETETVFGPGPPARIKVSLMGNLVADGRTQAYLLVDALDQWDHPAMAGADVRVSLRSGTARIGNAVGAVPAASPTPAAVPTGATISASSQPQEHYELGEGGRIQIPITASLEPGTLQVEVAVGDATDTESFTVAPYLRAPFVNGVISAGTGSVPAGVDGDGRYDAGGARKERIAVFGSGKVGHASALTFAYESQNRLKESSSLGPYVQDPNQRPYQTYGDSSTMTSDFHSNDRLYARIDNGRNNLMWGQYVAAVGDPQGIGRYQQQLSGVKGELGLGSAGRGHIMAFAAHNPTAFVSFSVPVTGLGSLMQPLHPDIIIGSDMLTLVALDRRTGAVVSQTPLIRNTDYTIDYATGAVRFLMVPLPFDAHFNPQVLMVQYQYQGEGTRSATSGFDFQYAIDRSSRTRLDVGYMNDATGMSNYTLATQTLTGRLPSGQWTISHAISGGVVPNAGTFNTVSSSRGAATALSFDDRIAGTQLTFNYANTGPGFANPFGGFTVNGLENATLTAARQFNRNRSGFSVTLSRQRNTGAGTASLQQTMTAQWRTLVSDALALTLGFQTQHQTNGPGPVDAGAAPVQTVTGAASQLQFGAQWKPAKRIDVNVQHEASLGGNTQVLPSQTSAEVAYELPKQGKIYLRELLGGGIASFAQSTSAFTGPSIGSRSTQIGVQRTVGSNTAIDSSYTLANTGSGEDVYAALGIQQTFKIGKRLAGNATMQSARATGAGAQGFTVFGGGLAYSDLKDFRASLSVQSRGGMGGGTTLSGGATGHIGPNIALLGTVDQTFGNGVFSVNDRISAAYRPSEDDRFISLFAYDRQSGGYSANQGTSDVVSFEEIFRPGASTEIAGRFAMKLDGDGYYMAHTSLAGLRVTQMFGPRFDAAAEVRKMNVAGISGARATDFAAELGYRAAAGTRVAAGYNFSGSADPTLTGKPQRRGFYLTVTTLVDRIFGWGKQ